MLEHSSTLSSGYSCCIEAGWQVLLPSGLIYKTLPAPGVMKLFYSSADIELPRSSAVLENQEYIVESIFKVPCAQNGPRGSQEYPG